MYGTTLVLLLILLLLSSTFWPSFPVIQAGARAPKREHVEDWSMLLIRWISSVCCSANNAQATKYIQSTDGNYGSHS